MHHATVSSAVVPLERKTPSRPMKSHPNMARHPRREAAVLNERTSIKQIGFRPCQVKGIWDPGVTPCEYARTPCNHSQSGHRSSSRCHSHSRHCSRSATPSHDRSRDCNSTSWKWPVDPKSRPIQPTPMQSSTQKMLKLKSVIQRVPAYKHFPKPPYKSLSKDPKDFIWYIQGSLDRKAYDAEIQSMAVLHNSQLWPARL